MFKPDSSDVVKVEVRGDRTFKGIIFKALDIGLFWYEKFTKVHFKRKIGLH